MRRVLFPLGAVLVVLTSCAQVAARHPTPSSTSALSTPGSLTPSVEVLGQPKVVFNWATQRCSDDEHPDLPVRVFRDANGMIQMTIASPTNYRLIGPSLDALRPDCTPVLISANDRDPSHYNTWDWLGATYTLDGQTIYAIIHNEYHADQVGSIWQADQDFGSTQGGQHWYYQSWNGATYSNMTFDTAHNRWQGSQPLCQISSTGAHPDLGCEPSRTWISPINGTVTINGRVYDQDPHGGNGVVVTIFKGSSQLWSATIANGDATGKTYNLSVPVRMGDQIHFRVNARGDNNYDSTYFNPGINRGPAPCLSGNHAVCQILSLTYAVSTDGGKTYTQPAAPNHIVAVPPYQYNPDAMRALWQPSNIVKNPQDGYYYMLVQRDDHGPAVGADIQGTCVMRTQTLNDPTSWRAWDGTGFNMRFINPYQDTSADPTQHTCQLVSPTQIGGLTYSLTYNTYFGAFIAVGVRNNGFYYSLSQDLVHWTPIKFLIPAIGGYATGFRTPYYAYPTLVDPTSPSRNFDVTGQTPYLYYSRFNSQSPLSIDLLRVQIKFSK